MENWLVALAIYFGLREAATIIVKGLALFPIAYANTLSKETRDAIQKDWEKLANDYEGED